MVSLSLFCSICWYVLYNQLEYLELTSSGGLFGPMIIHGPSNAKYDIDLGPVMLSDYYHTEYFKLVQGAMASVTEANFNTVPASDNNLINGKMNFNCSTVAAGDKTPCNSNAGISKFKFTTGKTRLGNWTPGYYPEPLRVDIPLVIYNKNRYPETQGYPEFFRKPCT